MKRRHMYALIATFLSAFVFSACSPFQRLSDEHAQLKHLDEKNYSDLEGDYQIFEDSTHFSLLQFLLMGDELSEDEASGYLWVELKVLDEHTLQFTIPHIDREARVLRIEGDFSDGCFYFDTIHVFANMYYVFWGWGAQRRRICLHESRDIVCSVAKGGTAFLIIAPVFAADRSYNSMIKRVDD